MSLESFSPATYFQETSSLIEDKDTAHVMADCAHYDVIPTGNVFALEMGIPTAEYEKDVSYSYEQRIADLSLCEDFIISIMGEMSDVGLDYEEQKKAIDRVFTVINGKLADLSYEGFYNFASDGYSLSLQTDILREARDRLRQELTDSGRRDDVSVAESALDTLQSDKAALRLVADDHAKKVLHGLDSAENTQMAV